MVWDEIEKIIKKMATNTEFKLTPRIVRVLNDVVQAEQIEGNFAYLYLNESPDLSTVIVAAFLILIENMLDNGVVDPVALDMETQLLFTPNSGKTQSVIFKGHGSVNGETNWILENVNKRGPYAGLQYSVDTQTFKAQVTASKDISIRSKQDIRKLFAEALGLANFSRTDEKEIIILVDKKILDYIEKIEFRLVDKKVKFGELITGQILKSTGVFREFKHTAKTSQPFITFVTNMATLEEYLADADVTAQSLYMIGNKWWKYSNAFIRKSLLELTEDQKINLRIIATTAIMMTPDNLQSLKPLNAVYAWFSDDSSVSDFRQIECLAVSNDQAETWQDIDQFIDQLHDMPEMMTLLRWLSLLRGTLLSTIVFRSKIGQEIFEKINDYLPFLQLDTDIEQELRNSLSLIIESKYPIALDNKLNQLGYDAHTLIVTSNQVSEEVRKNILDRRKQATVVGYDEAISESFYGRFKKMILINPRAFERRKWILADIAPNIKILYPSISLDRYRNSLRNDQYFIEQLLNLDWFKDGSADIIVNALKLAINDVGPIAYDLSIDNQDTTDEEQQVSYRSGRLIDSNADEPLTDPDTDRNDPLAFAQYQLSFKENHQARVLGTEHGKILVKRPNDFLEHIKISNVVVGDIVAYIKIEDCVEFYRNDFRKMTSDTEFRRKRLTDSVARQRDYYWKRKFLDFVSRNELGVDRLKELFAEHNYKRSVGFFQSWANVTKINFVPRDIEFIRVIGEIISDQSLVDEASDYHRASQQVRDKFQLDRQKELDQMEHIAISAAHYPISYLTVQNMVKINYKVNRAKTNCLLEGE